MAVLVRLRSVRDQAVLTQEELAERSGVSRSTIIRLEAGEDARPGTIRKLAAALGVAPAELFRPEGEPDRS